MFDPSEFSTEPVTFQENWEDNSYKMLLPGTKCVGVIDKLDHGREWTKEGKTYMGVAVTLRSTSPAGVIANGYLNSQPRTWGNKSSALEDLVQASGVAFDGNLTNQSIAEIVSEIHRDQLPVGFDITWGGYCSSLFELTLMSLTNTDSVEDAKMVATPEQTKEANRAAEFKAAKFKVNGEYKSTVTCEQTSQNVRARYEIRNILSTDDVDDQLGG